MCGSRLDSSFLYSYLYPLSRIFLTTSVSLWGKPFGLTDSFLSNVREPGGLPPRRNLFANSFCHLLKRTGIGESLLLTTLEMFRYFLRRSEWRYPGSLNFLPNFWLSRYLARFKGYNSSASSENIFKTNNINQFLRFHLYLKCNNKVEKEELQQSIN